MSVTAEVAMARVRLQVPSHQVLAVKRLGACWDPQQSQWFVPEGVNVGPFRQWLAEPFEPNVRAPHWQLATGTRCCWRCQGSTRVVAILLSEEYETLIVRDEPQLDPWQAGSAPAILSYVEALNESVAMRLRELAPRYFVDFSRTAQRSYWMNHCELCEAKLGDFETIEEFDSAFQDLCESSGAVTLQQIDESFVATCGGFTINV